MRCEHEIADLSYAKTLSAGSTRIKVSVLPNRQLKRTRQGPGGVMHPSKFSFVPDAAANKGQFRHLRECGWKYRVPR